jgi:hypothetical protein
MKWISSLCFLALPAGISACGTNGEELRCIELGDHCECSEPLNNDLSYVVSVTDPPETMHKECGYWATNNSDTIGESVATIETSLPVNARVDYVLSQKLTSGTLWRVFGGYPGGQEETTEDWTGKTFCMRDYRNYGLRHDDPGNLKINRAGNAALVTPAWQTHWEATGDATSSRVVIGWIARVTDHQNLGCNVYLNGDLQFDDCRSDWCRIEVCHDHDPTTGAWAIRGHVKQVKGTKFATGTAAPGSYGSCTPDPATATLTFQGGQQWEQVTTGPPPSEGGAGYMSHLMAAKVDYNPDFWIGSAHEIE